MYNLSVIYKLDVGDAYWQLCIMIIIWIWEYKLHSNIISYSLKFLAIDTHILSASKGMGSLHIKPLFIDHVIYNTIHFPVGHHL